MARQSGHVLPKDRGGLRGAELQVHAGCGARWRPASIHQIAELVHNPQATAAAGVARSMGAAFPASGSVISPMSWTWQMTSLPVVHSISCPGSFVCASVLAISSPTAMTRSPPGAAAGQPGPPTQLRSCGHGPDQPGTAAPQHRPGDRSAVWPLRCLSVSCPDLGARDAARGAAVRPVRGRHSDERRDGGLAPMSGSSALLIQPASGQQL